MFQKCFCLVQHLEIMEADCLMKLYIHMHLSFSPPPSLLSPSLLSFSNLIFYSRKYFGGTTPYNAELILTCFSSIPLIASICCWLQNCGLLNAEFVWQILPLKGTNHIGCCIFLKHCPAAIFFVNECRLKCHLFKGPAGGGKAAKTSWLGSFPTVRECRVLWQFP